MADDVATSSDFILTGGTGVLWTWVYDLVVAACQQSSSPVEIYMASRDHPVDAIGRTGGPRRALLAQHPNQPVFDSLAGGTCTVLAVLDDPVDMVRVSSLSHGNDLMHALRDETRSAIAGHLIRDHPDKLVVRRGETGPARSIASGVLAHLALDLEPEAREAVLTASAGASADDLGLEQALERHVKTYCPLTQLASTVPEDKARTIRQVLSPMLLSTITPDIGRIVWPRTVFLSQEAPDLIPPKVMDITGPSRCLMFGPYFYLPSGTWQTRFTVALSRDAALAPFQLVMQCNLQPLAVVSFSPATDGVFEGTFTFSHTAADQPVEVNLILKEGAIEGSLAVGGLSLTPVER